MVGGAASRTDAFWGLDKEGFPSVSAFKRDAGRPEAELLVIARHELKDFQAARVACHSPKRGCVCTCIKVPHCCRL
jgi:hypothetical protein